MMHGEHEAVACVGDVCLSAGAIALASGQPWLIAGAYILLAARVVAALLTLVEKGKKLWMVGKDIEAKMEGNDEQG